MNISVVIRSKDEADRLRLTLTSLARQTEPAEVVVVNDGSSDHTAVVLDEAAHWMPLTVIHHEVPSTATRWRDRISSGSTLPRTPTARISWVAARCTTCDARASSPIRRPERRGRARPNASHG